MKNLILFSSLVLITSVCFSQNDNQLRILNDFIAAHNASTETSIQKFIVNSYEPGFYDNIEIDKHLAFYAQVIEEFGPLHSEIYELVEEDAQKLIV